MAGRKKKVFSEPFSTDIPVQMYYGNLVLGKRLSGKLYTLAKTKIIYPKNVEAKIILDFT